MPDTSYKDQLKQLLALQNIDAQIYELRRLSAEKPENLKQIQEQFESKKEALKQLEENLKQLQVARKGKEGDLLVKDEAIAKANMHLSQIKTNKEYTAKIKEIENIKADKSVIEEQVLLAYDEGDKVRGQIGKEQAVVDEEEKKYLSQKQEIEKEIKEIEAKTKDFDAQRKGFALKIEKNLLSRYERILDNKDGLAMVPVVRAACGGCYMNVPPQVFNEIKKYDEIVHCEMCARILFLQEDLE